MPRRPYKKGRAPVRGPGLLLLLALACAACSTQQGPQAERGPAVFFPPPPSTPRLQHLASWSSATEMGAGGGGFRKFVLGEQPDTVFAKPYGLALANGSLFVCDTGSNSVVTYNFAQQKAGQLGARHPGKLAKPINIAVAGDGTRYVADTVLGRVMVYEPDDTYRGALGDPEAWTPSDVAIAGDTLYVTDIANGQVVLINRHDGRELRRLGTKGSGKGQLFLPTNVELFDRKVYVSDTGNFRISVFDTSGNHLHHVGSLGRSPGQFARPKGIALDRQGQLYVVDAAFENLQLFDRDGRLLLVFGGPGAGPGDLNLPAQVEIDYENVDLFSDRVAPGYSLQYLLLVASQYGRNKINVYGFLLPLPDGGGS